MGIAINWLEINNLRLFIDNCLICMATKLLDLSTDVLRAPFTNKFECPKQNKCPKLEWYYFPFISEWSLYRFAQGVRNVYFWSNEGYD